MKRITYEQKMKIKKFGKKALVLTTKAFAIVGLTFLGTRLALNNVNIQIVYEEK